MDDEQTRECVRGALRGDRQAFGDLVGACQTPVYNLALRMTGSPEDAADLTQEAFVRAWLNLEKYDLRHSFRTWLYTLALNVIRNHLKKAGRAGVIMPLDPERHPADETPGADPVRALAAKQAGLDVLARLRHLPLEQSEALLLRFFQDVSFKDMAEILNVSESAAKMRVRRGLEALRRGEG
ncbi:RNA polymerase subunit sigma-24 [Desulfonatronum sp. SC1]|nr:RNA polymerase subunit sigma-24 [Desulfonatronum sp. SC1]